MSQQTQLRAFREIVGKCSSVVKAGIGNNESAAAAIAPALKAIESLEMPTIVLIGAVSCGKSRLVESLVGIGSFLPWGKTQAPVLIKLRSDSMQTQPLLEMSAPGNAAGKKVESVEKLKSMIESRMEIIAHESSGAEMDSSDALIEVTITYNKVYDIDIIDTPGISQMSDGSESTGNSLQFTKNILKKANHIILAVTAANVDLATSESLKISKEVDESSTRTIGVMTKLDQMDAGTDCSAILKNETYKLQRGFVGVVNSKSCDEASFFSTDPAYKDIASKQGTKYLKKLCVALLAKSLKQNASFLDRKVNQLSMIVDRKISANKDSDRGKLMDVENDEENDSKMLKLILDTSAWVIKKFDMQLDERIKNGHIQDLRYYMNSSAVDIFKEMLVVFPNSLNKYPITVEGIIDIHLDNLSLFQLDNTKKDQLKSLLIDSYQNTILDYERECLVKLERVVSAYHTVLFDTIFNVDKISEDIESFDSTQLLGNKFSVIVLDQLNANASNINSKKFVSQATELVKKMQSNSKLSDAVQADNLLKRELTDSIFKTFYNTQFSDSIINKYAMNLMLRGILMTFSENCTQVTNQTLVRA